MLDAAQQVSDDAGTVTADVATVAADKAIVAADKAIVAADKAATEGFRDEAETFKDQAAASAASTQFPVATTTGTGAAYVADFTPDLTITDGAAFRLNLHTANTSATPTIAIDGTTYDLVRDHEGGAFAIGEMPNGFTGIFYYEAALGDIVLVNAQKEKWFVNVNANGNELNNLRGYQRQITYRDSVSAVADKFAIRFKNATRLHNVFPELQAGTGDFVLSHNGTTDITFGASPSATVSVTTTGSEVAVNHGGNAYYDFSAGDTLEITTSNLAGAVTLTIDLDTTENYS